MAKVTLYEMRAFFWECPKCHTKHYEDMIPAELTPQEMRDFEKHNHINLETMKGKIFVAPDIVVCSHCDKEFEAEECPLDE